MVVDAADRGNDVLLVADGCAAPTPDEHRFALAYMNERFAKVRQADAVEAMAAPIDSSARTHCIR